MPSMWCGNMGGIKVNLNVVLNGKLGRVGFGCAARHANGTFSWVASVNCVIGDVDKGCSILKGDIACSKEGDRVGVFGFCYWLWLSRGGENHPK